MKEAVSGNLRLEDFGGISIKYEPNGIGVLRDSVSLPGYVSMGTYAFSQKEILYTIGVVTCIAVVVRRGDVWGLYHDVIYPKSINSNWVYDSHRERLAEFLNSIKKLSAKSALDFAFLFGADKFYSDRLADSRIEAENALIKIGDFDEGKVISRWNDSRGLAVDIMVKPASSHIYVENVER